MFMNGPVPGDIGPNPVELSEFLSTSLAVCFGSVIQVDSGQWFRYVNGERVPVPENWSRLGFTLIFEFIAVILMAKLYAYLIAIERYDLVS